MIGGTKSEEYHRTGEMLVDLSAHDGVYFALALLVDSGYDRAELSKLLNVVLETPGAIKNAELLQSKTVEPGILWRLEGGDDVTDFVTILAEADYEHGADDLGSMMDQASEIVSSQIHACQFWAVSDWLADGLMAQGETVAFNLGGINVWARSHTCDPATDRAIEAIASATSLANFALRPPPVDNHAQAAASDTPEP